MSSEKEKPLQRTPAQVSDKAQASGFSNESCLKDFRSMPKSVLENVSLLLDGLDAWEQEMRRKKKSG